MRNRIDLPTSIRIHVAGKRIVMVRHRVPRCEHAPLCLNQRMPCVWRLARGKIELRQKLNAHIAGVGHRRHTPCRKTRLPMCGNRQHALATGRIVVIARIEQRFIGETRDHGIACTLFDMPHLSEWRALQRDMHGIGVHRGLRDKSEQRMLVCQWLFLAWTHTSIILKRYGAWRTSGFSSIKDYIHARV